MANEMRLIDANALSESFEKAAYKCEHIEDMVFHLDYILDEITGADEVDAVPVVHGRWVITAHEEYANFRWNVTAKCSECRHDKGEIYAGFFPGVPRAIAREVILDNAKTVKLDNYCPNCGALMDGGNEDG